MRRTGAYIIADADYTKSLALKNLYLIIPKDNKYISTILAQLNSKLFDYFHKAKTSGENKAFAQFTGEYIESFPCCLNPNYNSKFDELANKIAILTKELIESSQKFQRMLQRKFALEDLPVKLQNWHTLSYGEFVKELSKKKVKLTLAQEAEWEEYFTAEREKALLLKKQIDETDRSIDRMVYQLYGLTEEEIKIVER
jgi:hypothetical protein